MKIAAVTMAYNEGIYLPIWCKYYGARLGIENLFVIDHGSTDGSVQALPRGANVLRLPRGEAFDEAPRTKFVVGLQQSLLNYYDAVIYGDSDEIIVPDPGKYASFAEFLSKAPNVVAPVGLHLFQALDREEGIDERRAIIGQRRFCQFSGAMCKPTIVKTPIEWSLGFHSASELPYYADDIFLFHLKSMDMRQSLDRLARTRAMSWSKSNLDHGISHHHRTDDEFHLHHFFNSPLNALQMESNLRFDFREDVERARSAVVHQHGFYEFKNFNGKAARIPDRFVGIF